MTTLTAARSLHRGEVDLSTLTTLTAAFPQAAPLLVPDMLQAWDAVVVDGDLHLAALDTFAAGLALLVVTGNLVVDGVFEDRDHPATGVCVLGDMHCGDVVTSGALCVLGSLHVRGVVVGLGNDFVAEIRGALHAGVFAPHHHHFRARTASIDVVLTDDAGDRIDAAIPAPLSGLALRDAVVPELVHDDAEDLDAEDLDGMGFGEIVRRELFLQRIMQGLPIFRR